MQPLFGPPKQLGIVVNDIEKALKHWIEDMGVGPWYYADRVPIMRFAYKGKEYEGVHVSAAISHSGTMQIELIQPRHTFPSAWTDFLNAGHEGLHHWCSFETDYDGVTTSAVDRGLELIHNGDMTRGRFAYFLHPATPNAYVEIAEAHPDRMRMFDAIRQEALNWDGSEPIRHTLPV